MHAADQAALLRVPHHPSLLHASGPHSPSTLDPHAPSGHFIPGGQEADLHAAQSRRRCRGPHPSQLQPSSRSCARPRACPAGHHFPGASSRQQRGRQQGRPAQAALRQRQGCWWAGAAGQVGARCSGCPKGGLRLLASAPAAPDTTSLSSCRVRQNLSLGAAHRPPSAPLRDCNFQGGTSQQPAARCCCAAAVPSATQHAVRYVACHPHPQQMQLQQSS